MIFSDRCIGVSIKSEGLSLLSQFLEMHHHKIEKLSKFSSSVGYIDLQSSLASQLEQTPHYQPVAQTPSQPQSLFKSSIHFTSNVTNASFTTSNTLPLPQPPPSVQRDFLRMCIC